MAIASICTVGSKGQKAELVDGSLVCYVSVRPAGLSLQSYRASSRWKNAMGAVKKETTALSASLLDINSSANRVIL